MFMQMLLPPELDEQLEEGEPPFGSLPEEIADDIPAMLSDGEYVVPADVVRYWGLKHLEEMHTQAKHGLMCMKMDDRLHIVDAEDEEGYGRDEEKGAEIVERIEMSGYGSVDDEMEELDIEAKVDFDGNEDEGTSPLHFRDGGGVTVNIPDTEMGVPSSQNDPATIAKGLVKAAVENAKKNATGLAQTGNWPTSRVGAIKLAAQSVLQGKMDLGVKGLPGTIARAAISTAAPIGFGGALASAFGLGPSITTEDLGFLVNNEAVTMNLGVGVPGLFGERVAEGLATIAAKMQRNDPTVSKHDIGVINGRVVGVQRNTIMGINTAALLGTVPRGMTVDGFMAQQALQMGKVPGTAPVNSYGHPDLDNARELVGKSFNSRTGSVTAGYDPNTGYAHSSDGVTAMGTAAQAARLTGAQIDKMNEQRSAWMQIKKTPDQQNDSSKVVKKTPPTSEPPVKAIPLGQTAPITPVTVDNVTPLDQGVLNWQQRTGMYGKQSDQDGRRQKEEEKKREEAAGFEPDQPSNTAPTIPSHMITEIIPTRSSADPAPGPDADGGALGGHDFSRGGLMSAKYKGYPIPPSR